MKGSLLSQRPKEAMASNVDQTHRFQDGRRYHTFDVGAYCLPNNEVEVIRLGEKVAV